MLQLEDIDVGLKQQSTEIGTSLAGGRIINVTSGLAQLSHLSGTYRSQVERAASLEDLQSISFESANCPASFKPTYSLTKAMLNRATQILSKTPEFEHLSINAADPGWVR